MSGQDSTAEPRLAFSRVSVWERAAGRSGLVVCVGALLLGGALGWLTRWAALLVGFLLLTCWLAAMSAVVIGVRRVLREHSGDRQVPLALAPVVLPVRLVLAVLVLPFRPRKWTYALSMHCLICGRPLTSRRSQRARVGSTCIRRHGPRTKRVLNPAYLDWLERRRRRSPAVAVAGPWRMAAAESTAAPRPMRRSGGRLAALSVLAAFLLTLAFALALPAPTS